MKFQLNESAVKVALIGFNFIFSVLSVALIALGVVYGDDLGLLKHYVGLEFLELPILLIALGCLSFLASLLGCYCARNNNQKLMKFFIVFITLLLALELTISLISFFNLDGPGKSKTRTIMRSQLMSEISSEKNEFHEVESYCRCCGIDSADDYITLNVTPGPCCQDEFGLCTAEFLNTTVTQPGCLKTVLKDIREIANEIGCYSAAICLLQLIEILCILLRTVTP